MAKVNTLAGYVHELLSGELLGVGDALRMFPIYFDTCDYDQARVEAFDALVAKAGVTWGLRELFPRVLSAGAEAGVLTAEGAALLDPTGTLQPGIPMCPPRAMRALAWSPPMLWLLARETCRREPRSLR